MSKKTQRRRKLETVDSSARDATRLTGLGLGLGLMLAAGSAVVWWWLSTRAAQPPSIAVPSPDTSTMEPQVAARIRAAQQAVRDNRASASAWGMLGMVLHAHELTADAAACYEGASRLDPESGRWLYLLARARQTEEPVRAKAAAMEAARSMPSFLPARLLVAELEEATSQEEAALDAYRAALELDASAAAAEFGVARLLLASGKLDEGLRHLERAATLAPESGAIQASLARSYGRAGRSGEASRPHRNHNRSVAGLGCGAGRVGRRIDEPWPRSGSSGRDRAR